ncbi:MAG: sensor histidine kinase [Bacteroidota bacterium]
MNNYLLKKYFKIILLIAAFVISVTVLFLSRVLTSKVAAEEKKKVALWAKAVQSLSNADDEADLTFYLEVIQTNTTIPAIVVDETGKITQHANLDSMKSLKPAFLKQQLELFKLQNEPILVPVVKGINHKVYYGESTVLRQLRYYPYVVLTVMALFMMVSYFAFSFSRRAEQNQVWVGLAKETAHQLGTPITSLMGWVEYLEMELGTLPNQAGDEMRKDVRRLNIITERFSKIGSEPVLQMVDVNKVLRNAADYMEVRVGHGVEFEIRLHPGVVYVELNVNLFDWVIENLIKNSIDAMEGKGKLLMTVSVKNHKVFVDISDNGKGMPRNNFKAVFKPGFTTKRRGWGLGLSLAKRIVTDYHKGQIFVKESIPFIRTTFRIVLNEMKF